MARLRMVTRTITVTKVRAFYIKLDTLEKVEKELEVSGDYSDVVELNKELAKTSTENEMFAKAEIISKVESLYGMPEADFIKNAQILPARGTNSDIEEV